MSQNQKRVEKKEKHYRKTGGGGRLNNTASDQLYRSLSATGRGASPAPPLSSNNRSFKKSSNGQDGQSRRNFGSVTLSSDPIPAAAGVHPVENGNHVQSTLHGVSSPPAAVAVLKPADASSQKSRQPIPNTLSSQSPSITSDSTVPSPPSKGEAGKGFPLQFGSISPGVMNVMQVPTQTSAAPPNLDEQKHDEIPHAAARAVPAFPVPYAPKQQVPEKHVFSKQPISQETHTATKVTRDVQLTSASSPIQPMQAQKPAVHPMTGMSMPLPYQHHQPPLTMHFGGPNPQIQTHSTPNNSLQMSMQMPLHIGNLPQVQQQVFVPGIQRNLMQNPGIIHQGQSFGFNPQLEPKIPHQPGNLRMNLSPHYNLQQPGIVGSTRKVVKITHPETHKELRLDNKDAGSPKSSSHHMGHPSSQPMPAFAAIRPGGFYSDLYTPGPPIFPASTQLSPRSQGPRFNYSISQGPLTTPFMNQSASNSFRDGKGAASMHGIQKSPSDFARSVHNTAPSVHNTAVDSAAAKGTDSNAIEKTKSQKFVTFVGVPGIAEKNLNANVNDPSLQLKSDPGCLKKSVEYAPTNMDANKKEAVIKLDSMKDVQKHSGKIKIFQPSPQVNVPAGSRVFQDPGDSLEAPAPGYAEAEKSNISLVYGKNVSALKELPMSTNSGSNGAPVIDLGAEKFAAKDQHATQNGHLLQGSEQQKEKGLVGLEPGGASRKEGDNTALQTFASENVPKCISDKEMVPASAKFSEKNSKQDGEIIEKARPTSSSGKTKSNREKKKWKEMLQKEDSLGTTSDMYMAYKGPEEKNEIVKAKEGASWCSLKIPSEGGMENITRKKDEQSTLEFEDWEDAVDVAASKLESTIKGECRGSHYDEDSSLLKKYSRDFLLTFSEQCTDLPECFKITPDITDILLGFNANASRSDCDYASSGRNIDRASKASRNCRHANGVMDSGKWNKSNFHFSSRHPGLDLASGGNILGFHSGQGLTYDVLRNSHGHGSIQHAGGILSGPMHLMGFQGIQKNNPYVDSWQRATNFDKGLMLTPQTPSQLMHRADNKYEVGKVSDEEQAKQRRLKAILNKLTPENFEKLFEQVKEVNIDNTVTLTGVISQIFDKALTEPTFCEMYANFCSHLASELPDLSVDDEKITFKRLLLNKCQEEFERGEREEEEANKDDGVDEIKQTEEEREGKKLSARRRMLGNIRLIGELYKKRMLTERIMHECIKKLLGQYQNADEENIEALCKLMSTIGEMIDHPRAKEHMDAYFDIMRQLSNNMKLSSRVRFMLKDAIDLRKNKWQQRMKVEGPKKIDEVHRDAAQERLGQTSRTSRGTSMNSAMRRGQTVEYGHRGSMLPSPIDQMSGFRGFSTQVRGYDGQDERINSESRTFSVPFPQGSCIDEPITLGPQGGLTRGMSCRGQPSRSMASSTDRRMVSGLNGFSNASDHGANSSKDIRISRQTLESFGVTVSYGQSSGLEPNPIYTNKDVRNPDRSMVKSMLTSSPIAREVVAPAASVASEKVCPEERLGDKSMAAIMEYYSANDEKEVALCVKDLNAPKFYPLVISMWVTDAFERKDLERDMLTKLLISLTKPQDSIFSPQQLIEGLDSVLTNLDDTVTDAPKAPEYLGWIFGKLVIENVFPLNEVGRLIHGGGEEPGHLLETGLAGDVLGSVLEIIKSEKGESMLNEIRTNSNLRFEDFRPPDPLKSKKLEMFIM